MTKPHRFRAHLIVLMIVAGVSAACEDGYSRLQGSSPTLILGEEQTWAHAELAPLPPYPVSSLQARTSGPAVSTVLIAQDGSVRGVRILQAPDRATARALGEVLWAWKFRTPTMPQGAIAEGTITVYFERAQGMGRVVGALQKIEEKTRSR